MTGALIPTSHLLRILRGGIEKVVLLAMKRAGMYDATALSDIFTYMSVLVVVSYVLTRFVERVVTEDNVPLRNSIAVGLLVALVARVLQRSNLRLCLRAV